MPRIRTIKPEFFRHEKLQDLEAANPGAHCMLVFIGLWTQCDNQGVFPCNPRQLKLDILPFLDFDMENTLDLLSADGFLYRYTVNGKPYGIIKSFPDHQRFNGREAGEKGRKYPGPDEADPRIDCEVIMPEQKVPVQQRGSTPEATGKQQGSSVAKAESQEREREREHGKGKDKLPMSSSGKPKLDLVGWTREIFDYWKQVHGHQKARLDDKRKGVIQKCLKIGYSVDDIKIAIDGCLASPHHQGENNRGAVYDDIELICRDAKHIDMFIKCAREPNQRLVSAKGRQARKNGQTWLDIRRQNAERKAG